MPLSKTSINSIMASLKPKAEIEPDGSITVNFKITKDDTSTREALNFLMEKTNLSKANVGRLAVIGLAQAIQEGVVTLGDGTEEEDEEDEDEEESGS